MEVVGGVASIVQLVSGVAAIAKVLNDLKERYEYAALHITLVASSLWSVKAALEAIDRWRRTTNDDGETSLQLDRDLNLSLEACACLVSVIDRKLKDTDILKPTVYDKVRFVALDSIFKDFTSHLDTQIRGLQLILQVYQCQTITERSEKLRRRDTRKVFREVEEQTFSLDLEDRDLADAVSILSEEPSVNLDVDSILLNSRLYRKVYGERYLRRTRRLSGVPIPSPRNSAHYRDNASLDQQKNQSQESNDVLPSILPHGALPFLGIPFKGEGIEKDKLNTVPNLSQSSHPEMSPVKAGEFDRTSDKGHGPGRLSFNFPEGSTNEKESRGADPKSVYSGPLTNSSEPSEAKSDNNDTVGLNEDQEAISVPTVIDAAEKSAENLKENGTIQARPLSVKSQISDLYSVSDQDEKEAEQEIGSTLDVGRTNLNIGPQERVSNTKATKNVAHSGSFIGGEKSMRKEAGAVGKKPDPAIVLSSPNIEGRQSLAEPNHVETGINRSLLSEASQEADLGTADRTFRPLEIDFGSGIELDIVSPEDRPVYSSEAEISPGSPMNNFMNEDIVSLLREQIYSKGWVSPLATIEPRSEVLAEASSVTLPLVRTSSLIQRKAGAESDVFSTSSHLLDIDGSNLHKNEVLSERNTLSAPSSPIRRRQSQEQTAKTDQNDIEMNYVFSSPNEPGKLFVPSVSQARTQCDFPEDQLSFSRKESTSVPPEQRANLDTKTFFAHDELANDNFSEPLEPSTMLKEDASLIANGEPNSINKKTSLPGKSNHKTLSIANAPHIAAIVKPNLPLPSALSPTTALPVLSSPRSKQDQTGRSTMPEPSQAPPLPSRPLTSSSAGGTTTSESLLHSPLDSVRELNNHHSTSTPRPSYFDTAARNRTADNASVLSSSSPTRSSAEWLSVESTSVHTGNTTVSGTTFGAMGLIGLNPEQRPHDQNNHNNLSNALKGHKLAHSESLSVDPSNKNKGLRHRISGILGGDRAARIKHLNEISASGNVSSLEACLKECSLRDVQNAAFLHGETTAKTPLMRAAAMGHVECIELLVKAGSEFAAADKTGRIAIHFAIESGKTNAVEWLASRFRLAAANLTATLPPGPLEITDSSGRGSLALAASIGHCKIVEVLLKHGANMEGCDISGNTVLFFAISYMKHEVANLLIRCGANIHHKNKEMETPLIGAAKVGSLLTVQLLLEKGADRHCQDQNGDFAIHHASRNGHLEIVEVLYLQSSDLELKNSTGQRPLHLAAAANKPVVAKALLQSGCNPNASTEPPLNKKRKSSQLAFAPLHYACQAGNFDIVHDLVSHGALVNSHLEDGTSPLMLACKANDLASVVFLLQKGANVNAQRETDHNSALHISAAKKDSLEIVKELLDYGANVLLRNKKSEMPSMYAINSGDYDSEVLKYLNVHRSMVSKVQTPFSQPNAISRRTQEYQRPSIPSPYISSAYISSGEMRDAGRLDPLIGSYAPSDDIAPDLAPPAYHTLPPRRR